jgi:hypothetical protein
MKADKMIIGFTDSVNECDCCGKTELKGTYCVIIDGIELYYGSTCVKNNLSISSDAILNAEIKKGTEERKKSARNKFESIGAKELEKRIPLLEVFSKEWDELDNKVSAIKKSICLEFNINYF